EDEEEEKDVEPEDPQTDPDEEDDLPETGAMSVLPLGLVLLAAGGLLLKKKS
ncbi:MAG TPA: LPXTG cell wall anchor domain-containing protein, partial [Firmicutes bacterium]|nr:LPXTG cell wall anchor domain-containing protein [Bacillota bacterium]